MSILVFSLTFAHTGWLSKCVKGEPKGRERVLQEPWGQAVVPMVLEVPVREGLSLQHPWGH